MTWQIDSDGFAFARGTEIFYTRIHVRNFPYEYAIVEYDDEKGIGGIKILDFARNEYEARNRIEKIVNRLSAEDDD